MKFFKITHLNSGKILSQQTKCADDFLLRLKGLMFSRKMAGFDGLILEPCSSIHTFFMKFTIDAIFINKENTVVAIYRNMKPWKLTPLIFKARKVLELAGGSTPSFVKEGDKLGIECIN